MEHDPTQRVERDGDHWRYTVTCDGIGCHGAALYGGIRPTEAEAHLEADNFSEIHKELCTVKVVVRPPVSHDHIHFARLFANDAFMKHFGNVPPEKVGSKLEEMWRLCQEIPYAAQAVLEGGTDIVVGCVGAAWFKDLGKDRLEFTYRTDPGRPQEGFAEAASLLLLALWMKMGAREMVGRIAPCNTASIGLAKKLKFERMEPVRDDPLPDGTSSYRWRLDPSKIESILPGYNATGPLLPKGEEES